MYHAPVSFIVKMSFIIFKTPVASSRYRTTRFKPFRYALMIKQALKKHGTKESHAIDAKKIVFLKDNFVYYSITY